MTGKKVVVGLSGGVDSSVAAALLTQQGYQVTGAYLECYNQPGCRTDQDKADALKVAIQLQIPYQVLDFRKQYREKVIEYFYHEYEEGRTPNPDVMCNREIKFGIFYDWAMANGFDYMATGHYGRITNQQSNILTSQLRLQRARDESKDQSYFLWQIPRDHLRHILFPLGALLKREVRQRALELGLHTANKPDSMGICFIGEVDTAKLLRDRLGDNPGEVMMDFGGDTLKVGEHKGLWFYTIGERRGFELDKKALKKMGLHPEKMRPLYVIKKDKAKNQIWVGRKEEAMTDTIKVEKMITGIDGETKFVRIRNLGELYKVASIHGETIKLEQRIFGVAGGQSLVLYDGEGVLVGGSTIV